MLLNERHFADDPGGGGQSGDPAAKATFDRATLPPFLQKYEGDTMEKVLKAADTGYWNMVNHTTEVMKKAEPLAAKAAEYDRIMSGGGGQPKAKTATELLAETLGLEDASLLARALDERAGAIAAATFTGALTPVLGEFTATEELAAEIGDDFAKIKPQVKKWIDDNPSEKQWFDQMRVNYPRQAWELAIRKWGSSSGASAPASGGHERAAMGMIAAGQPSATRTAQTGPSSEALKLTQDYHQAYGDWRPHIHERAKGTSIEAAVKAMDAHLNGIGTL